MAVLKLLYKNAFRDMKQIGYSRNEAMVAAVRPPIVARTKDQRHWKLLRPNVHVDVALQVNFLRH